MAIKPGITSLVVALGFSTGFIYAAIKDLKTESNHEPVIVAQPPMEAISYLDYINEWTQDFTISMVEFETQTLELNQNPKLYADKKVMDTYSEVINEIIALTTDLIVYPIDSNSEYSQAHEHFKESAIAYNQAMTSMWNVATFYQLDVNSDIIDESFERSISQLKAGMSHFQSGVSALH